MLTVNLPFAKFQEGFNNGLVCYYQKIGSLVGSCAWNDGTAWVLYEFTVSPTEIDFLAFINNYTFVYRKGTSPPLLVDDLYNIFNANTDSSLGSLTVGNSAVTLLAANPQRRQFVIHNDGGTVLFIRLGSGITSALYSCRLTANERYEQTDNCYTGVITAIRASGTGSVLVTEVVL